MPNVDVERKLWNTINNIAKAATSGTVDLTGYAKTADANSALNTKDDIMPNADVERKLWNTINNKVERSDLTNYATKSYVTDEINKAGTGGATGGNVDLTGYAKKTDLNAHTSDTNIHITSTERNKWNNKAEKTDIPSLTNYATKTYVTDEIAKAATSGTVDLTGYAKTVDVNASLNTKVDKVTGKSLVSDTEIARLKNVVNYDDSSIKTSITNINSKLDTKANKSELFSGNYNDLTNKPTIPSLTGYAKLTDIPNITGKADKAYVDTELSKKANKSELFSGSYNDLTDKPTIPDVSNLATKTYVTDEINKASLSGGTVDLSGYAKTADVNASLSNKVNKSGDTMTGPLSIKKSGDDATLLTFDTERPWSFKQGSTGSNTSLDLVSSGNDKNFRILNTDKTKGLDLRVTPARTEVKIDGNKVYHSGDKPKLSELTNDAGFITSAVVNTSLSNKVDKASITTTISSSSTDTQVPSAKSIYYNCLEGIGIDQSTIDTYGTEILKYPLGIWRIESISLASNFTDLPIKVAFRIEITSIDANVNKNPWNSSYGYRVYNFETYDGIKYVRAIESGSTTGVIGRDTGWQRICTTSDVDTKVDKIDGKGLSTNDYTTDEKTKVSKIITSGDGSKFLANDGTYKNVSSSASSAVAERKFKPVFGFDTYWGEMRDNHGNKNQVDLATIKQQIDECESMKVDRIICTIHIGWDETTNSLVIAENTDSILTAISYCNGKNVTIDTAKVHVHFKGTSKSEKDYVNDVIGMSTFQTKYKAMLTTICNLFKNTTVTRIIILNEMWYITNAKYGYSSFVNECLNIVKSAGYTTGLSMAGFNSNLELPDAVIQNIDTFYINVYPGISGFGSYITKSEAIEAFKQCDIDLWIEKTKKMHPDKKIVISEMGTDDYWENLAAPSSWQVSGTSKTGGHAVDTYITAMMEFFINKHVDIEELWWWYNLYYEPVKETLLNYLGGRYFRKNDSSDNIYDGRNFGD